MKLGKKLFVIMCILALTISLLAACSKNNEKEATSSPTDTGGATTQSSAKPEEPYKITIMAPMKETDIPSEKVLKIVEEKTGYDLEYQWVPDGNYEEKLNTSLATGSFPQVVYMKNQDTFIQFKEAIRNGQFWEIGPYLKDFPNLSKLHQEILDNTKVDGKLYTLYMGRDLARQGAIYRKDWMDKLGMKPPTNTDELFDLLKAFTEDDPDGNNKNDTFGLTDRNDLVYGAFKTVASWFHTPNNWGEKDGQLLPEFMFPEYVQTMDWFKKVRDAGYMNKEFPVTSKTDQRNLFYNGKAGVYIGAMTDAKTLQNETQKNFPNAVVDVFSHVNGPDGKYTTWSIPGYGNVLMFPKASVKTEDDLKKILGYFDKTMTPEIANLLYWGIEGEHYTLNDGMAQEISGATDLINKDVREYRNS
ncbi:MAG TPA: extracellular solute-binding protein, partial [Bacilli bacterium]